MRKRRLIRVIDRGPKKNNRKQKKANKNNFYKITENNECGAKKVDEKTKKTKTKTNCELMVTLVK